MVVLLVLAVNTLVCLACVVMLLESNDAVPWFYVIFIDCLFILSLGALVDHIIGKLK